MIDLGLGQLRPGLARRGSFVEQVARETGLQEQGVRQVRVRGTFSLGFHTTALPATSAWATWTALRKTG